MVDLQLGGVLDVVRIGVLVAWGEEIVDLRILTRLSVVRPLNAFKGRRVPGAGTGARP